MKSALLLCDEVPRDLAGLHGDYPKMYGDLFPELDLVPFCVYKNDFPAISDFDFFVIGGSKYSVYDEIPWILHLKDFVRNLATTNKKCLGICFGHQMIAEALGGKVEKSPEGFLIGVHTFEIIKNTDWIGNNRASYNVLMLCQDQVMTLPDCATVLATNQQCPVGMYEVEKRLLGIQGHPEFSPAYNRAVFESRSDRIDALKIKNAVSSLSTQPDQSWLRKIMMNFLGNCRNTGS